MSVELLAPVGSFASLIAAVENGADAVYLGGKMFSARAYATNFDNDEMLRAREYTYNNKVRMFVTVNTLVSDGEMEEALSYLGFLYRNGIDAVIVQDLGIGKKIRQNFPNWELHGSTQMTVHNAAGVKLLEEEGYSRVILARELSLEEIAKIASATSMEIEVFVHGALCICYSGQCLMSSMIGGRSGNRGRCAQPCRLKYKLIDRETMKILSRPEIGEHLLSPKDLKTVEHIPKLIASGVKSFKVEGRMKRPEYVATVIKTYRDAIDRYLNNPQDYFVPEEDEKRLLQIFNRGFTPGYFFGYQGKEMMSFQRPNNRGMRIGRVVKYREREKEALVKLEEKLHLGDGVEFWVSKGGRVGTTVSRIKNEKGRIITAGEPGEAVWIYAEGKIFSGDRVFKTYDAELMAEAQAVEKDFTLEKIPVFMRVYGEVGSPLSLEIFDGEGNRVEVETESMGQQAQKHPLRREVLAEKLGRLGDTRYFLAGLETHIPDNLILPIRELNDARRRGIRKLEVIREKNKPWIRQVREIRFQKDQALRKLSGEKPKIIVKVGSFQALEAVVKNGADGIILSGETFRGQKKWDYGKALSFCRQHGVKGIIASPRISRQDTREMKDWLDKVVESKPDGLIAENLGYLFLFSRLAEIPYWVDFPLNIFNSDAIGLIKDLNAEGVTLSPELSLEQIRQLKIPEKIRIACILHGRLPLMVSEYCPIGSILGPGTARKGCSHICSKGAFALMDEKGFSFPIENDTQCRMHLYNGKELCMLGELEHFKELPIDQFRLELAYEGEKAGKITYYYREAVDNLWEHEKAMGDIKDVEDICPHGFTKGHYFRGVL